MPRRSLMRRRASFWAGQSPFLQLSSSRRWIGPECFRGRCLPTGAAASFPECAFGDWFPSRAERTIHPLALDCDRGLSFQQGPPALRAATCCDPIVGRQKLKFCAELDAGFGANLGIRLARSGSIRKKAKDCHVGSQKKLLNERKNYTSTSALFNPRAWSDYKFVIKKGVNLIRKSVTNA